MSCLHGRGKERMPGRGVKKAQFCHDSPELAAILFSGILCQRALHLIVVSGGDQLLRLFAYDHADDVLREEGSHFTDERYGTSFPIAILPKLPQA